MVLISLSTALKQAFLGTGPLAALSSLSSLESGVRESGHLHRSWRDQQNSRSQKRRKSEGTCMSWTRVIWLVEEKRGEETEGFLSVGGGVCPWEGEKAAVCGVNLAPDHRIWTWMNQSGLKASPTLFPSPQGGYIQPKDVEESCWKTLMTWVKEGWDEGKSGQVVLETREPRRQGCAWGGAPAFLGLLTSQPLWHFNVGPLLLQEYMTSGTTRTSRSMKGY